MKHKFKPSVGSNRARKQAPGGGRGENKTSGGTQDQPAGQNSAPPSSSGSSEVEAPAPVDLRNSQEVCPAVSATLPAVASGQQVGRREVEVEEGRGGGSEIVVPVEDRAPPQSQVTPTSSATTTTSSSTSFSTTTNSSSSSTFSSSSTTSSTTISSSSSSLRIRKKVAPTVISSRPRRPKRDSSNCDQPEQEQSRQTSAKSSTAAHTANLTFTVDPENSDRSRRDTVAVEDGVSRAPCQPHTLPARTISRDDNMEGEERSKDPDRPEPASEVDGGASRSGGDGNLSGVVRSSLDLVCPPPTGGEGATFQLGSEERRQPTSRRCVVSSDEEEGVRQPGEGVLRGGEQEGTGGERQGDGETGSVHGEAGSDGNQEKEMKKSRSRKRPAQSKTVDAATTPGPKKRRTGGGGGSRGAGKVRKAPDRTSMTMQELIYYNPTANPMSSSVEEKKKRSQRAETSSVEADESRSSSRVQTPAPAGSDASSEVSSDTWGDSHDGGRIVPQLRMDKDGCIVLDEDSMVVAATARPLPFEDPLNPPLVESCGHTTSASYRKNSRVTRWTGEETKVFFKALSQVGTDFTMMTLLLPKRTRKELKNKFKKEEKSNPHRVTQALRNQIAVKPSAVPSSVSQPPAEPTTTATTPAEAPT